MLIYGHEFLRLRLQYTFGSAIFFKFGFLGQNSGRRIISNF